MDNKIHLLFIRFSSLGDIVLNSGLPAAIKKRWGDRVHISFLTSKAFAPLVEGRKDIDQVHGFPRKQGLKDLFNLVEGINKERKIDFIVDMHGTLRSLAIRFRFPSIPRVAVDKRTPERTLLTLGKLDFLSTQGPKGREKRFGELLLERNIRDFSGVFDYEFNKDELSQFINESPKKQVNQGQLSSLSLTNKDASDFSFSKWNLDLEPEKYICLVPSASFPEKRWPLDKFLSLTQTLLESEEFNPYKFVVLAGPEDDFCKAFDPLVEKFKGRLYNLQGKTSLIESAMMTKKALFCMGNDTGVPHVAETMGTPGLFILGPTGEEFGFYPHLKYSRTVSLPLWCRPCTTNGKGRCIRSERYCLTGISPELVFNQMKEMKQELNGVYGGNP